MITLLLKSSLVMATLLGFYKVFLEKESFFAINRAYLIASIALTFTLPFIRLPQMMTEQGIVASLIEKYIDNSSITSPENMAFEIKEAQAATSEQKPVPPLASPANTPIPKEITKPAVMESETASAKSAPTEEAPIGKGLFYWLLMVYYFGLGVFTLNFIFQIVSVLLKIWRSSDVIQDIDHTIINTPVMAEPCSFFHYIFINPEKYDYEVYEQILAHEKIHVRKKHSLDLLLSEISVILLWFNPFVWLFRKEVEKNMEYQTDDILLNGEQVEKEEYQMNLLKVAAYSKPLTITTNYNQSLLKQRIMKISTKKSNPHSLWKYAFVAPLLLSLLLLINKPNLVNAKEASYTSGFLTENSDTTVTANISKTVVSLDVASFLDYYKNLSELEKAALLQQLNEALNNDLSLTAHTPEEKLTSEKNVQSLSVNKQLSNNNPTEIQLFDKLADKEQREVLTILNNLQTKQARIPAANIADLFPTKEYNPFGNTSNQANENDCIALLNAVRDDNAELVKTLLQKVDPNCIVHDPGNEVFIEGNTIWNILSAQTPLVAAGRNGNLEIARLLVSKGADVNHHGASNETPLMAAAKHGDLEFVKFLVTMGAKVKTLVEHWGSALSIASAYGHIEIVKYLKSEQAEIDARVPHVGTSLLEASQNGHIDVAKYLVANGANVNADEAHVGTPLIAAAQSGHLETVKYLIAQGAKIDEEVAHVGTAILVAAQGGHFETVEFLASKGADVDKEVAHVGTPLLVAAEDGLMNIVILLLTKKVDINKAVAHVGTPLSVAAEKGHLDMASHLIANGADINKEVAHVGTPLLCAAESGQKNMVKLLIEKGADPNKWVMHVGSPLTVAKENGHNDIVAFLRSKGATQ